MNKKTFFSVFIEVPIALALPLLFIVTKSDTSSTIVTAGSYIIFYLTFIPKPRRALFVYRLVVNIFFGLLLYRILQLPIAQSQLFGLIYTSFLLITIPLSTLHMLRNASYTQDSIATLHGAGMKPEHVVQFRNNPLTKISTIGVYLLTVAYSGLMRWSNNESWVSVLLIACVIDATIFIFVSLYYYFGGRQKIKKILTALGWLIFACILVYIIFSLLDQKFFS